MRVCAVYPGCQVPSQFACTNFPEILPLACVTYPKKETVFTGVDGQAPSELTDDGEYLMGWMGDYTEMMLLTLHQLVLIMVLLLTLNLLALVI